MKPRIGEMVILKDYPDAKDWYVAEISQVLSDRFTVNGFITMGIPLAGYARATRGERIRALKGITFLCKDKGKGIATTIPPAHCKGKEKYLWKWRLSVGETDQLLMIRNVCLDRDGCLCKATKELAAALKFAHHVGAGGEETASRSNSNASRRALISSSLSLSCLHIRPCVKFVIKSHPQPYLELKLKPLNRNDHVYSYV